MSKIINTILLSTTLMLCSQGYTSTIVYDPIRNLVGDTGDGIEKCDVEQITDINNGGKVYYKESKNTKKYLVDNEGYFFIDYESCVTDGVDRYSASPWNTYYQGKINLILTKDCTQTTEVPNTISIKSIIIPKSYKLTSSDGTNSGTVSLDAGLNTYVLCLGTFVQGSDNTFLTLKQSGYGYTNFIFGPNAVFDSSNSGISATHEPIKLSENTTLQNVKFLFYPGSKIKNKETGSDDSTPSVEVVPQCQVILNRYIQEDEHLYSKINENANVIFPSLINNNREYELNTNTTPTKTSLFSKLEWSDNSGNRAKNSIGVGNSQYDVKDPDLPLKYNINDDTEDDIRNGKVILGVNEDNDFAKYDVALWDQCSIDNENYGLQQYNTEVNKGNYIDTDNLHKLFYDMSPSDDIILTNTTKIYPGLIGSKNIILDLSLSSDEESRKIYFCGDNSNYTGTIIIKQNENNPVTDIYYDTNSMIARIKFEHSGKKVLNNVICHLLGNNTIDLAGLPRNHIWMNIDNTTEEPRNGQLTIIDSSKEKYPSIWFMQQNYLKYSGKINIPNTVTSVYVNAGDLLYKIEHGDNKTDLSNLKFYFMRNVTVDINDISKFDMSLSNEHVYHGCEFIDEDDENNTDTDYGATRLVITNNSNSNISTVEFTGDNTGYKHLNRGNNTGYVFLPSCVTTVNFKDEKSFVRLLKNRVLKVYTDNNILSVREDTNMNINHPSYDKKNNIKFTTNCDDPSDIDNILKYNTPDYTWDTDSMSNVKYKGKNLLSNLKLNMIFANLLGSEDITLTTDAPMVNIMGNNTNYKGKLKIPNNVGIVLYGNKNSEIKNLISSNKSLYTASLNNNSSTQDDEQDIEYETKHIAKRTVLNAGKKIKNTENEITGKETIKHNLKNKILLKNQNKSLKSNPISSIEKMFNSLKAKNKNSNIPQETEQQDISSNSEQNKDINSDEELSQINDGEIN